MKCEGALTPPVEIREETLSLKRFLSPLSTLLPRRVASLDGEETLDVQLQLLPLTRQSPFVRREK